MALDVDHDVHRKHLKLFCPCDIVYFKKRAGGIARHDEGARHINIGISIELPTTTHRITIPRRNHLKGYYEFRLGLAQASSRRGDPKVSPTYASAPHSRTAPSVRRSCHPHLIYIYILPNRVPRYQAEYSRCRSNKALLYFVVSNKVHVRLPRGAARP